MSPIQDVSKPTGSLKIDSIIQIANSRFVGLIVLLVTAYAFYSWINEDRIQDKKDREQSRVESLQCNEQLIRVLLNQVEENTSTNKQILKYLEKHDK